MTVVVPSYNMEAYLPKCLGSLAVAPELMEKLEVLVVNDGSKDGTSEIGHDFEARWPGVFKVIDKTNGNYGSCINAALKVATGKYVKVLDADDWFDTEVFAHYLEAVDGIDADVVLNDFDFVHSDGSVKRKFLYDWAKGLDDFTFQGDRVAWMHGFAYRTEMLKEHGYRQTEGLSYTDQEWVSIPMTWAKTMAYVPGRLYKYLVGREGQTCEPSVYARQIPQQITITRRLMEHFGALRGNVENANRDYLDRHLKSRIRTIYLHATLHGNESVHKSLAEFDEELKAKWPALYAEADGVVAPSKFRFHCVRAWRKNKNDRTFMFWLFRLYLRIK